MTDERRSCRQVGVALASGSAGGVGGAIAGQEPEVVGLDMVFPEQEVGRAAGPGRLAEEGRLRVAEAQGPRLWRGLDDGCWPT